MKKLLHCWGARARFLFLRDHGDLRWPRLEEEEEAGEEATMNRTDLKWIHDDVDDDGDDEDGEEEFEDDEVWLRLRALIYFYTDCFNCG